jgi:hypothetical protein
MTVEIEPLRERDELRAYIDTYWAPGHILAREPVMADFTYATPWVNRVVFPAGYCVLGAYSDDDRLLGFLGATVAPYPRQQSHWLALWHVLPELKGTGLGGSLLRRMQEIAVDSDGWIGGVGISADALPVYLSRGYTVRGFRRWVYTGQPTSDPVRTSPPNRGPREEDPSVEWFRFRYDQHPLFQYERHPSGIFRTENNEWGRVTHAVWLADGADELVRTIFDRESQNAGNAGKRYVLDAWSFEPPGPEWELAEKDLPSVFHPPEARGNRDFAVGMPFLPTAIQKGDGDLDRPN